MRLSVPGQHNVTIYRIGGDDETALVAAMALCLSKSKDFLRAVLSEVGIKNLSPKTLDSSEIFYQRHGANRREGITDIEVIAENKFHLIIEAKIGAALPTIEQCKKYIRRFGETSPQYPKCLAILVETADTGMLQSYRSRERSLKALLRPLLWAKLCDIAREISRSSSDRIETFLLTEFSNFIEGEYHMKSYQEEVWFVPLKVGPLWKDGLSFHDIPVKHKIYFHPAKKWRRKSIYFAPRAFGKVECVQQILKTEYDKMPKDYIPDLGRFTWGSELHTIFHLGDPVKLPRPVKSGKIRNSVVYADFDLLITADSVKQAGELTRARKKKSKNKAVED